MSVGTFLPGITKRKNTSMQKRKTIRRIAIVHFGWHSNVFVFLVSISIAEIKVDNQAGRPGLILPLKLIKHLFVLKKPLNGLFDSIFK